MKKLLTLSTFIILIALSANCFAQNKQLEKALKKQVSTKMKEIKKDKWKVDGSRTLEVCLLTHYDKLADPKNRELISVSNAGAKSRNVCQQSALNNAMVRYGQEAKAELEGKVATMSAVIDEKELDKFYGAYEWQVSASIEGELKLSFALYKENPDGTIADYEAYYIINEDNASKLRMRAMKNAAKESEAAQRYADKLMDFLIIDKED